MLFFLFQPFQIPGNTKNVFFQEFKFLGYIGVGEPDILQLLLHLLVLKMQLFQFRLRASCRFLLLAFLSPGKFHLSFDDLPAFGDLRNLAFNLRALSLQRSITALDFLRLFHCALHIHPGRILLQI